MSSNAIEGLFSRAKRHLRTYRGSPQSKEQVGDYLGALRYAMGFCNINWSICNSMLSGLTHKCVIAM